MSGKVERVWTALRACFDANKTPLTKAQVLAWIGNSYPGEEFNRNTLVAQLYRSCVNVASVQKYKTPKFLVHDRRTHTYFVADASAVDSSAVALAHSDNEDEAELEPDSTFALESHLRDYLARNLQIIEKGLTLWSERPPSVEYAIEGRFVDILAKDLSGNPVVIELKLNKSYDRVVGQALLYQGLVERKINHPKVRMILVAGEVSDELKIACAKQKDLQLFEYT